MNRDIEPLLHPVKLANLRPTQMTVGLREVALKRHAWRNRINRDGPDYLGRHMIPVVIGPKERFHMIDHHHLGRALLEEGVKHVLVRIIADLRDMSQGTFETFLDNRNWLHPYDADGKRQAYQQLPKCVADLSDDPYRSLAGELRRAGGYAKSETPFAEFLWADFLRRKVRRKDVEHNFDRAVARALQFARGREATYLPGWVGPA